MPIYTDKRSNIYLPLKRTKEWTYIDIVLSADQNIVKGEDEIEKKYQLL